MIPPNDAPVIKKDTVYFHFVKPTAKPNVFQSLIQYVQKNLGFSKYETTHVFVSLNEKIIDRTGIYTVTSGDDAEGYLRKNYTGHTIESFGIRNMNLQTNFLSLFNFINLQKPYFFEDETGEVFGRTTIYPNNSIYALGLPTLTTLKEVGSSMILRIPISEADAIKKANAGFSFKTADKLENPTYCSLTVGVLIPELRNLQLLRYPALTHSLFESTYKANGIDWFVTVIEKN